MNYLYKDISYYAQIKKLELGCVKKVNLKLFKKGVSFVVFFAMIFQFIFIYSVDKKTAALETNGAPTYIEPLTYEFNFLTTNPDASLYANPNTEGWFAQNAFVDIKDGCLKLKSSDPEVAIEGESDLNLKANQYNSLKIVLNNDTNADRMTIYYDSGEYNWSETRSVSIKIVPNDVVFREYIVDLSQSSNWVGIISRCKIGFNNTIAEGTLSIDRIGYYPDLEQSEIFYDFSKGGNGVNGFENSIANFTSVLSLKSDGKGDARFKLVDNISADASKFKYIQFNLNNLSAANAIDVYYTTEVNSIWTKTKGILNVPIKGKDTGLSVYTIDMRKSKEWFGRIKNIMVVIHGMNKDEIVNFSSISIINKEILPDININFKLNTNEFYANTTSTILTDSNGIKCIFNGENGGIVSPNTKISANEYGFLKIRLKNNTMSTALRFQWLTEKDNIFDIKKNQNIIIDANSKEFKEYIIPLVDNQYWDGNISKFKIMPAIGTVKGDITVESIVFTQYADVSFLYRDVKEGFIAVTGDYGWIKNTNGGEIAGVNDKTADICDTLPSTGLYPTKLEIRNFGNGSETSAWKYITDQNDGILQWNFTLKLDKLDSTGNTIKLMNNNDDLIKFEVVKDILYLNDASKNKILVHKFDATEAFEGINVRVDINNQDKKFTVISLNDEVVVKIDAVFISQKPINRLFVGTDGSCQNVIGFSEHISKIDEMYEDFNYSRLNVKPFMFNSQGNVKIEGRRTNYSDPIIWHSTLGMRVAKLRGTAEQTAQVSKSFTVKSNVVDTSVKFLINNSNDETYIKLLNGTTDVVKMKVEGKDFKYFDYNTGEYKVLWSKFKESHPVGVNGFIDDVWYTLKIRTFTETGKVELSINGLEPFTTILPANINYIDTISLETKGELWFNDIRINDYRPTIVPYVDRNNNLKDGYVGVDAWQANTDSAERFNKNERIVNKRSLLGYTNDWDKESLNWQLKWMAENGIDFISYFFVNYGYYTVDTYLDNAEYSNQVNFAYTIDNYSYQSFVDLLPNMVERLFRNPKYIKYNNKPVLFYFREHAEFPDDFQAVWDKYVRENSEFDGIELVNVSHPITDESAKLAKTRNVKYITEYWRSTTPELLEASYNLSKKNGVDYIFKPSLGGDSRAWGLSKDYRIYNSIEYVTPTQFYNTLKFTKTFINDKKNYSSDSLASKMVFIDNWSEFGEGHSVCPYGDIGFNYVNQIRRVFAGEDGIETGKNSRPSAFVDHLFPTGWMIEKLNNPSFEQTSIDSWRATDETKVEKAYNGEFNFEKTALKISERKSNESALYQDITSSIIKNGQNAQYNISAYVKPTHVDNFKDFDYERVMTLFSSKYPQMALGLSADESTILLKPFNPNDNQQKWIVSKVADLGTLSQYTFKNMVTEDYITEEFVESDMPLSKIVMRSKENNSRTSQVFSIPQVPNEFVGETIASVNSPNIGFTPDTPNKEIPNEEFCNFFMIRVWNDYKNKNILFKLKDTSENPQKPYRAPVSVFIEISDSQGIKRFECNGNAKLGSYTELTGSVNISWVGNLNYARFVVNGDTSSNRDYFVDECEMRYVPTNYKQIEPIDINTGDIFLSKYDVLNGGINSDKLISEISQGGSNVVIDLDAPGIIKREVFKFIKRNNKNVMFRIVDIDNNVIYYWKFRGEDINNTNIDVDISISQTNLSINAIEKVIKDSDKNNTQYMNFSYLGILPGKTSIGVENQKNFNKNQKLVVGNYNKDTDVALNQNVIPKTSNGFIEFNLSKISSKNWYITSGQPINPITGYDINPMFIVLIVIVSGLLVVGFLFRKKKSVI